MLAQPGANAPPVGVAAILYQAAQPVLLLDGLNEEGVARERRNRLVKLGVEIEQVRTAGGVRARQKGQVSGAQSIERLHVGTEGRQEDAARLEHPAEIIAVAQRGLGADGRQERPAVTLVLGDNPLIRHCLEHAEQDAAVGAVALAQRHLRRALRNPAADPVADDPAIEVVLDRRRNHDDAPVDLVPGLEQEISLVAARLDDTLLGEALECGADQRSRDAETLGKPGLDEVMAATEFLLEHMSDDVAGEKVLALRGLARRHPCS